MNRVPLMSLLLLCVPAAAVAQPSAEHLFRPGTVAISLYAGGAAFSAFRHASVRPVGATAEFRQRLSAHTTGALATELMWWLSPSWGMRVHGSWLPSRFDVQLDAEGSAYLREHAPASDTTQWKRLDVWVADVAALVRPPFSLGRVSPYAVLGAGIVSYRARGGGALPPGTEEAFAGGRRTSPAAVVGIGAAVPLQRQDLVLSFAVTNHITRTPVDDAAQTWAEVPATDVLLPESTAEEGRDGVSMTSNVRMMVGITVPLRIRR